MNNRLLVLRSVQIAILLGISLFLIGPLGIAQADLTTGFVDDALGMLDPKGPAPPGSGSCDGDMDLQVVRENLIETAPGSDVWQQTLYLRLYDDTAGALESMNGLITVVGAEIVGLDYNPRIDGQAAPWTDLPNATWAVGPVTNYDDNGKGSDGLEAQAGNPLNLFTDPLTGPADPTRDQLRHNGPTSTAPPSATNRATQVAFLFGSLEAVDDIRILLEYNDLDPGAAINYGDAWFNLTLYTGPNTTNPLAITPGPGMQDGNSRGVRIGEWDTGTVVDDWDFVDAGFETTPDAACVGDPNSPGEGNGGSTTDGTQTINGIRLQVEDLDIDDNGGSVVANTMTLTATQLGTDSGTFVLWNGSVGNDVDGDNGDDEGGPDQDTDDPVAMPVSVDLDNLVYNVTGFAGLPPGSVTLSGTTSTLLVDNSIVPTVNLAAVDCTTPPGTYNGTIEVFEDNDADSNFDDPTGLFPDATGETRDSFAVQVNITADPGCAPPTPTPRPRRRGDDDEDEEEEEPLPPTPTTPTPAPLPLIMPETGHPPAQQNQGPGLLPLLLIMGGLLTLVVVNWLNWRRRGAR